MDDKIVVIHQPDFLPYIGFFDRLLKAEIYVVLDNVQYVKRGWNSRDKIKTAMGEQWLSIEIQKAPWNTLISQIRISENTRWRKKHLSLIWTNYHKSQYFAEVMPYIESLYEFQGEYMMDFNMASIKMLLELFDIKVDIVWASDLHPSGKNNALNVDILKKLEAKKYLSGIGARDYYDPEPYQVAGIEVIWQDFKHPVYPQQFEGFIPYLSSIDLLFNCGIEKSRVIIRGSENIQYL